MHTIHPEYGKVLKVTVPSGRVWEIRESNGDDEATLSTLSDLESGENVYNFLANIIIGPTKPLSKDIADWPVNDVNVLIFKHRILNHGSSLIFKHTDAQDAKKEEVEYTEDLSAIDADLGAKDYQYDPHKVFPYPNGADIQIEFVLSSKKKLRFKIMTGVLQAKAASIPQTKMNRNTSLFARDMEWFNDHNQWEVLFSFRKFTSKEMVEIRAAVDKYDPPFNPEVTFKNPNTGNNQTVPVMSIPTFYFPEGTI